MNQKHNRTITFEYQGARWVRADLHLHSPGAFSFKLPVGMNPVRDKKEIIKQYVDQLRNQSIGIGAVTDYQGIHEEWFPELQAAARKQEIVLFPGAELSFKGPKHGLHVLAVFPLDMDPAAINRLILHLDRSPAQPLWEQNGKHRDIDPEKSIKESLQKLKAESGAVLVFPHPNDQNGIFKSYRAQDAAELIAEVCPDAIEQFSDADRQRLLTTAKITPEILRKIASVEFSDPKCIEEIGAKTRPGGSSRTTYFKLSVCENIQPLRLALHDWEILVRVGDRPGVGYTHLTAFEVDGSGFLGNLRLTFSPELNVLVGGRGVGKSAILECIRYVIDLPAYAPTEYRENLVQYALGSGGKAMLYVEQVIQPQVRRHYRFERVWGESPRVFESEPEREVELTPLDVLGDREYPLFFGQREIYEISRDERRRLRLLDEIIGRQAQAKIIEVRKLETRLKENARGILDRRRYLQEREEIEQRLKEIQHQIALYEQHGVAGKLRQATTLAADEQRLRQAQAQIQESLEEWQSLEEEWHGRWENLGRQLDEGESQLNALLAQGAQIINSLQSEFQEVLQQGKNKIEQALKQLKALSAEWEKQKRSFDEEVRGIKQQLGEQALDPDQLIRLTEEQTRLKPRLTTLKKILKEIDGLYQQRRELLGQLRGARRLVWQLRHNTAKEITGKLQERVRIEVDYRGQREAFIETLRSFFQGSNLDRKSIERMVESGQAVDGYAIAEVVRAGASGLEEKFELTATRAQQIVSFLSQDEMRLLDLEIHSPEDAVRVYLKLDEKNELPLEKLSDGQRATAMLLLLLIQEERLLLVDQPEEDLDNRFIYDDIVQILRQQKRRRQLLAATHNPNIPVLGNAELIIALEASAGQASINALGGVDRRQVQDFVKKVMEGGEDAFRRRAEKYGWA